MKTTYKKFKVIIIIIINSCSRILNESLTMSNYTLFRVHDDDDDDDSFILKLL